MAAPEKQEGIDTVKIYIIVMFIFSILSFVWYLYNSSKLSRYQREITNAEQGTEGRTGDIQLIWEMTERLKEETKNVEPTQIDNPRVFFKRVVPDISPEPEVTPNSTDDLRSDSGQSFQEKTYTVAFAKIRRQELCNYIFQVEKEKPFIKAKEVSLTRIEDATPFEEPTESQVWEAKVIFGVRATRFK